MTDILDMLCLKESHPRKSSRGLLRKRRQAGSIPAVKLGLKNAGENAMPRADARTILCDIVDAIIKGHISRASLFPQGE